MRAYLIVLVGHFSNMKWGVGDDHVVYGWVFFGLTMFVLFWMGAKWRDAGLAHRLPSTAKAIQDAPSRPIEAFKLAQPATHGMRRAVLGASLVTIGLSHVALAHLRNVTPTADFETRAAQVLGAFGSGPLAVPPQFSGARASLQGVLDTEHGTEIYLGYFARQEDGAEMIASGNTVLPASEVGWQIVSKSSHSLLLAGREANVTEWRLRQAGQERLLWSWYTIAGVAVASDYKAKALTAWSMLTGGGDHSTVTIVSTRLSSEDGGWLTAIRG
jgi:EpsI family protein